MDISLHLQYFTHDMLDPVVWLRIVRVVLFFFAALLMFKEPMMCGGRNKWFHYQLAIFFAGASIYNYTISKARMTVITQNPGALVGIDLLLFECVYTILVLSLVVRLGYDYYRVIAYNKVKTQTSECGQCPRHFQP